MAQWTEPRGGALTHLEADWAGLRVLVTGLGVSGFAAADTLLERGARVIGLDAGSQPRTLEHARLLEVMDAGVVLGDQARAAEADPAAFLRGAFDGEGVELVVTSPGWRPTSPLLVAAAEAGLPVWGEVELAWRMRRREGAAPWLCVTGTNGKTTTVQMLESILRAAGRRAVAAGNVGLPILDAVIHPEPYDVIAVELSSFQLHWSHTLSPLASAILNIAPDHLDWHGSLEGYAGAKGRIYERTQTAIVFNEQDAQTYRLAREADVVEGCRAVSFTLGTPAPSMLGVVEDVLADRAFTDERRTSALELATFGDLAHDGQPPAPHYVADALAAAALARAYGVDPVHIRDGLRAFRPDSHRIALVGEVEGVRFVDDSKATNPHAAQASLLAYDQIVWVAGGDLKGAEIDELVQAASGRLRAAVVLGKDARLVAEALGRHASDVPVTQVDRAEGEPLADLMGRVVRAAHGQARHGDVVLLAPAAASIDMFAGYGERGDLFAAAVQALREPGGSGPEAPQ